MPHLRVGGSDSGLVLQTRLVIFIRLSTCTIQNGCMYRCVDYAMYIAIEVCVQINFPTYYMPNKVYNTLCLNP